MPPIGSAQQQVYLLCPSGTGPPGVCRFLLALALSLLAPGVTAAPADPLFVSLETLQVRITGPMRALSRDRDEEPEERPGTFAHLAADGTWRSFEVGLEPRGKSRRDREVCRFPPLRVDFRRRHVPPYAVVDGQLPIRSVRDRMYRGFCWDDAVMHQAVSRFQQARDGLFEVMDREAALEARDRDRARRYLEEFFAVLDEPGELADEVLDECRGSISR